MSVNPQMMAQMLAGGLNQPQQGQQSPLGTAAQLAQKVMLMQALQRGQVPQMQPGMPPGMPVPQAPAAQTMPGVGTNA